MGNPLYYPNGKGDEDRTKNREQYRKNYDRIFGKKKNASKDSKKSKKA